MNIYEIECELKVHHLYSVAANSLEEAKQYLEKERYINDIGNNVRILDKVFLGSVSNEVVNSNIRWED